MSAVLMLSDECSVSEAVSEGLATRLVLHRVR